MTIWCKIPLLSWIISYITIDIIDRHLYYNYWIMSADKDHAAGNGTMSEAMLEHQPAQVSGSYSGISVLYLLFLLF